MVYESDGKDGHIKESAEPQDSSSRAWHDVYDDAPQGSNISPKGSSSDRPLPGKGARRPIKDRGKLRSLPTDVQVNDIDQGAYSDCMFESAEASLAQFGELPQMISTKNDGTYTVTFPGDKDHPVTVNKKDLLNSDISDSGYTAAILEAACVKKYPEFKHNDVPDGFEPFTLLTGKATDDESYALQDKSPSQLAQLIHDQLANHDPIIAGTFQDDYGELVSDHAYSVVACDTKNDTITLRNPWGTNPNHDEKNGVKFLGNGEVQIPIETFENNFFLLETLQQPQ